MTDGKKAEMSKEQEIMLVAEVGKAASAVVAWVDGMDSDGLTALLNKTYAALTASAPPQVITQTERYLRQLAAAKGEEYDKAKQDAEMGRQLLGALESARYAKELKEKPSILGTSPVENIINTENNWH